MQDWTGNSGFFRHGNNRNEVSAAYDYYATEPKATEILLENEKFQNVIFEPAAGEGHISKVLKRAGYTVVTSDIVARGESLDFIQDFFDIHYLSDGVDIITNPPYKYALEFCQHGLSLLKPNGKLALFLKLTFLEGKKRKELFSEYPPKVVYVFSSRVCCGKNGVFNPKENAVAYAWFICEQGYKGETVIKWVN